MLEFSLVAAAVLLLWFIGLSALLVYPWPPNWLQSRKTRPREGTALSPWLQWYPSLRGASDTQVAVLLVHGRSRSRGFMEPMALALRQDFAIMVPDLRHHGDRGYGTVTYGILEAEDLNRALDAMEAKGCARIGVVAVSMGGAAAAKALADRPRESVRALALLGPVASAALVALGFAPQFGIPAFLVPLLLKLSGLWAGTDLVQADTSAWLAKVPQPKALLTGDHDEVLGQRHSEELKKHLSFDLIAAYPGGHDEPGNPALQALLRDWLKEKLSEKPSTTRPGIVP